VLILFIFDFLAGFAEIFHSGFFFL